MTGGRVTMVTVYMVVFFCMALVVLGTVHWYLWWRCVATTTRPGSRPRRIASVALVLLGLCLVGALVATRTLPITVVRLLGLPGYTWMALLFYLLLALLLIELPRLAVRMVLVVARRSARSGRRTAEPADTGTETGTETETGTGTGTDGVEARTGSSDETGATVSRRLFLARSGAAVAGLTAVACVGAGVPQALGEPRRTRVRVPLARLPRQADGFRIAMVSDIHLGPTLRRGHTERLVRALNEFEADCVAIVGDLADGRVSELAGDVAPLTGLRSRYGTFFVTGNHEYYVEPERWLAHLPTLGIRVLRNERVALGPIDLAGVNDLNAVNSGDAADYEKALGGRDSSRPVVLLAHQPAQVFDAAKYQVDLQLSGHTHGGQLWPFMAVVKLQQPTVAGLDTVAGIPIFTSTGAGFWGPPVRLGAPPEVALIELTSAA